MLVGRGRWCTRPQAASASTLLLALLILGALTVARPERSYPYLSALIVVGIGRKHGRSHDHDPAPSTAAWRGLVALGLSGGIVPSASALLLLLAALSVGRPDLGLAVIIALGIGMAAVRVGNQPRARWGAGRAI